MIKTLKGFFQKFKAETNAQTSEVLCANCWGTQEYDDQIRELYEDRQISVNNHEEHYAFIKNFVVTRVDGIKLIKGENGYTCPTCHIKYDG